MITKEQKTMLLNLIRLREEKIDAYVRVPNSGTQNNANEAINNLNEFIASITVED